MATAIASALFGLWGFVTSKVVSESVAEAEATRVRSKGVIDPADVIQAVLKRGLVNRFALQVLDEGKIQTRGTSAQELAREYPHADLVLDVRTSDWGMLPTSATRYAIFYEGTLRLIDTRRQAIIAEGSCTFRPGKQSHDPSYDALMWQDATILKEKLQTAIQYCVDDYRTRVLGLTTQEI